MKESLCVLVLEEFCGEGQKTYVAQALEQDIATQVAPGASLFDVIEALGDMFDAHDAIREIEKDAEKPPMAPMAYYDAWQRNSFNIGDMPLGKDRRAHVRLLRDGYAIAILGRKRPEIVKR